MSWFSTIIKTAIETAKLPIAVVADITTLGGVAAGKKTTYTTEQLENIKDASEDK